MITNLILLLLVTSYKAFANDCETLELGKQDNKCASALVTEYTNTILKKFDVLSGHCVNKVTENGFKVWQSLDESRLDNVSVLYDSFGARLATLNVKLSNGKSQLLCLVLTLNGWVDLNGINPFNVRVESPNDTDESPLDLVNGEGYFATKPENVYLLDLSENPDHMFDYKFTYTLNKFVFQYTPRDGYDVILVKERTKKIWSSKKGQKVKLITAEKQNGEFVSLEVSVLESKKPETFFFLKTDGVWGLHQLKDKPLVLKDSEVNSVEEYLKQSDSGSKDTKGVNLMDPNDSIPKDKLPENAVDLSLLPEPPACRTCTYEIEGITYNVMYFHSDTTFKDVLFGSKLFFQVPSDHKLVSSCMYTRNDNVLFVDFMLYKDNANVFVYFEKSGDEFVKITKTEFDTKFKKYRVVPVVLDISKVGEDYSVVENVSGEVKYSIYTPKEGRVIRKVIDDKDTVMDLNYDILEVTVYFLDKQKILSAIVQNGPDFKYEYFTYYTELAKWSKSSEYFYYKLIEDYTKAVKSKYSVELSKRVSNKFLIAQNNEFLKHVGFLPTNRSLINSVYDSGRLVWTSRKLDESCIFAWYQYEFNLLFVMSNASGNLHKYTYEKTKDKWSLITYGAFKDRFNFIYSTNATLDIMEKIPSRFDVVERGNIVTVKPKETYMINRVKYSHRIIWLGTPRLKCSSVKIVYSSKDVHLFLTTVNYEGNVRYDHLSSVDGNMNHWHLLDNEGDVHDDILNSDFKPYSSPTNFSKLFADPNAPSKPSKPSSQDHLVVTEITTDKNATPNTDLSSDTTQLLNGIEVKEGTTLKFNTNVDLPSLTKLPKKNPTLTLSLYTNNESQDVFYDARDSFEEKYGPELPPEVKNNSTEKESSEDLKPKSETKADSKVEPKNEVKNETKPETKSKSKEDLKIKSETKSAKPFLKNKTPTGVKSDDLLNKNLKDVKLEFKTDVKTYGIEDLHLSQKLPNKTNKHEQQLVPYTTESDFVYPEKSDTHVLSKKSESKGTLTLESDFVYPEKAPVSKSVVTNNTSTEHVKTVEPVSQATLKPKEELESYSGHLEITKLHKSPFGEFKDARKYGFNYLLFNAKPEYPLSEVRYDNQTVWKSFTDKCLAVSVFLKDGVPAMMELFVKCSVEVRRLYFEKRGDRWSEVPASRYDAITSVQ